MNSPYFLVTNRGFYRAGLTLDTSIELGSLLFTSNLRYATPFSSFKEAEDMFRQLRVNGKCREIAVADYFSIVTTVAVKEEEEQSCLD